jgi:hypothetical protein
MIILPYYFIENPLSLTIIRNGLIKIFINICKIIEKNENEKRVFHHNLVHKQSLSPWILYCSKHI